MLIRGICLIGLGMLALLAASGCGSKPTAQESEKYPVRTDWLVKNVPSGSGQPTKWFDPGYPPLQMLSRPADTLSGDDLLLVRQKIAGVILNPRSIEEDVREEFSKVMTDLYGTPTEPRVPKGELLISEMKLGEKLESLQQNFETKRAELATARKNAKTPDETAVADIIDKQSIEIAKDLRSLQQRIEFLQGYEAELQLDPATLKDGAVHFRNYCQQCHGLTGDGNGPGGRFLIPLPRDYRQGLFKFISTDPSLGSKRKPNRNDLHRTITKGLEGSPMPQFGGLKPNEIQSIISYVIHLSMRGEAEFEVMKEAVPSASGDEFGRNDVRKGLLNQASIITPLWLSSARAPIKPDANPYAKDENKIHESAANGFKLFMGEAACTTCHANFGRSAPYQFDSWGSIVRPRNLTVATLRGGRKPEEIYARIFGGIPGSNMPAHAHLRPNLTESVEGRNKIWDLVNFVIYVSESEKRQLLRDRFQVDIEP
ncbi:MAG: c-type cytochrome [Planctomycetes bacterium]|nr:c-type cytochrome [Planctomycetota bacterium]